MTERVDKGSMPCNKPRRTPGHPEKSHVVKACYSGKQKVIRFGEQGASTAGKPKVGESERMTKKRASFKARHAKNIAKGPSSAAYWADKVKWNTGGHVELKHMLDQYEGADDVHALTQKFKSGGPVKKDKEPGLMDYLESVANTVSSIPDLPQALYQSGKRAVQAAPQVVRSGIDYVRRSSPQKVASDVRGGLNAVARQVREKPVETLVDFIPVVGDIKAYGEDVNRAAWLRAKGDERGAADIEQYALPLALASIVPGVGEARKAGKVADVAGDVARAGTKTMKRPASFPVNYGKPEGNLNLRPSIDPVTLKGAEVQDVESLINQLRGRPGVTKQGLERVASEFFPGEKLTAAQFGERMPRSAYSLVDLAEAADDVDEHLRQEAMRWVDEDSTEIYGRVAEQLGLPYSAANEIEGIILDGTGMADEEIVDHLRIEFGAANGNEIRNALSNMFSDTRAEAVRQTMEDLREQGGMDDFGGYAYRDYQRLVPGTSETSPGYFEAGVSHPEIGDLDFESVDYRGGHYPKAQNLAGHIRGTFNPEGLMTGNMLPAATYRDSQTFFTPKPNSMLIEELQSDVAKQFGDTGPLHQIHGTLFKGAVQKALEGGADTVYLPTAKTIAMARRADPKAYSSIYDKEVIKYGLNPLREIPGVEVSPIDDMYHEITISPEARERILKGAGQKAPGYAQGGLVSSYDDAKVASLADQIREGIYG